MLLNTYTDSIDFNAVTGWVHDTLSGMMPAWGVTLTECVLIGLCLLLGYAVIALALIAAVSDNPFEALMGFLTGPLTSVNRLGNVVELVTTINKVVPPDPTSAMFWLTNRKPETWKYKPETQDGDEDEGSGVVLLSPVMDNPGPPTEGGANDG